MELIEEFQKKLTSKNKDNPKENELEVKSTEDSTEVSWGEPDYSKGVLKNE